MQQKLLYKGTFLTGKPLRQKYIIGNLFLKKTDIFKNQCFGSGSESGWIRIQFEPRSGIRIRIRNPDPDSGSRCLKIGLKSQNLL